MEALSIAVLTGGVPTWSNAKHGISKLMAEWDEEDAAKEQAGRSQEGGPEEGCEKEVTLGSLSSFLLHPITWRFGRIETVSSLSIIDGGRRTFNRLVLFRNPVQIDHSDSFIEEDGDRLPNRRKRRKDSVRSERFGRKGP